MRPERNCFGGMRFFQARINPNQSLSEQGAEGVSSYVAHASFTKWHKRLMPLIQSCVSHRHKQSRYGPTPAPAVARTADAMKYRNTKRAEFNNMSKFSNGRMHKVKSSCHCVRKEPAKKRIDHTRGLFAAEIMSGKNGYEHADEDGRDPVGGSSPGRRDTIHRRVH